MFPVVAKFILLCINVTSVQLAADELYCGVWPDIQQIIYSTQCQLFEGISQKTVFEICKLQKLIEL